MVVEERRIVAGLRASGAVFGYLHGSRAAGTARPDSDTDVAAHFGGRAPAAWSVDLPDGTDLVVLETAPLYLSGRIACQGRLLFDDAPPTRVHWEADVRTRYLDELPYIEQMAQEYLQAVAARGRR
ncbi:nucleotidyltransferase domain-containing protein [Geodermatophilus sp. DF01-2]|uniref:nucleotidyltransferase domain-containing protein n=1 Tax=Geodermatophilus sp. DF01-2 TaxID=2559610 RepID=UPI0010748A82|nr:nucleotidyltransferase domain-containing protein [Geodermatophilus sp. DF01_2]TFV63499.1 nucleotidyltransferase domain-containing protein [Geodermatophilus sp. DF01_2]